MFSVFLSSYINTRESLGELSLMCGPVQPIADLSIIHVKKKKKELEDHSF